MIGHITRLRGMADASAAQSAREHPRAKVHSAKLAADAQAMLAGAAALEREAAHCVWRLEVDQWGDGNLWHSACGRTLAFTDDVPFESHVDHCLGCGAKVLVALDAPHETGDDDAR